MSKRRFNGTLPAVAFTVAMLVAVSGFAQYNGPLKLGVGFPELDLEFVQGESFDPAEFKGEKITVIEFWATWCTPCLKTIPHLTKLQDEFGEDTLRIIGISNEARDVVMPFVEEMGEEMGYTVAVDQNDQTTRRFRRPDGPIPRAFVFNQQGRLIWIGHPAEPDLEQLLWELTTEVKAARGIE